MADVSRPVSLSKKTSNVNDISSKHVYDDVFSAPPAAKLDASRFSSRLDDYREIFPSSSASLGSSIPILDLPAVDRRDHFGRAPSSGVDYADVFGGPGDDDGMRLPSEQLFGNSKKAQRDAYLPRSQAQLRRVSSKSQEFSCNHRNDQRSTPAQTRMQYSKSQEFPRNSGNNQMSMSSSEKRPPFSKSEECPGDSSKDQTSASELSHQTVDSVKHFSVSYHKTGQLSKDGANGMTHIAHVHAVSGYTHLFDEARPVRKTGLDRAKSVSMADADFSVNVGAVPRRGKHTRAASDLGTNKGEANCKLHTYSMSLSNSPQSFGNGDYFKRPANQRSKCSRNNRERSTTSDSIPPLLDEELDVNSAAAVSAAAMKRAIEEAEEKIRWAKEFLKGLEVNGFIKPTLKDSFKFKAAIGTKHSSETYGPKENGNLKVKATRQKKRINEEKVLKSNGCLNIKASGENNHANEAGSGKPKDALDIKGPSEGQFENVADGLQHRLHGVATQMDTNIGKSVCFRNPAPETFEETSESLHQLQFESYKTNAHEELKFAEKIYKNEGGGEWEAAKHISQLISGFKSRLVSFISKQTDTEKSVMQKEVPSKFESLEQSEEAYKVQHVDTAKERGADQENLEKQLEINQCTFSVVGESTQDTNGASFDMEICEAEENEVKRSAATSPDIEQCTIKQSGPPDPVEGLEETEAKESAYNVNDLKQEDVNTEVKGECLQEVQERSQENLDGFVRTEYEKSQMDTIVPGGHANIPEAAYQSRGYDEKGTNWEDDEEAVGKLRDLEPNEKGVDNDSLSGETVNYRQLEGCSWEETKTPNDAQKKRQEDVRMVEETRMLEEHCEGVAGAEEMCGGEDTEKIAGQHVMSEATEGLIEVVDEASDSEHVAAAVDISKQDELLCLSENQEASTDDERNNYFQDIEFSVEEKERMAESATVPFEPKENVEQPRSVRRANEIIREGICEEPLCSIEVADEGSEHDGYLPAIDDMYVQDEQSSSGRDEAASAHDNINQCAVDVDLPIQKERMAEPTFTTATEGNIEKPSSVQMANEVNGDDMSENTRCPIEAADETLKHGHYLPTDDDVCEKNVQSFLNENAEAYRHDYRNQYAQAQDVKCSSQEKIVTTGGNTSESEGDVELPSSLKMFNELTGKQMAEMSMSAGDRLNLDNNEIDKETEKAHEGHPGTNIQITEHETVLNFEQKHSDEETKNFVTDVGPENRDDEPGVSTSTRDATKVTEEDASSLNDESSHKRKRWFENTEEVGGFRRAGIFQGNEITLEMDQHNAEGSKIEDRVDIHVDEIISESGEGGHAGRPDTVSGQDQEGGHSSEGTHRRRRWFESSGEVHKPNPFNGVGVTTEMDEEIAQKFKHEVSSQNHVDKLVNERKDDAAVSESIVPDDQVESRVSTEAVHRRRRWFENGEKLGAAQRPGILEDNGVTAQSKEEKEMGVDTAKHDDLHEKSSSGDMANACTSEVQSNQREKEKERLAVERAIREARQRAFVEARERAAVEARLKATAAAQDKQGKASFEGKSLSDKASVDAKLRAERAAVERATAEARERALQKAMSEKSSYNSREKDSKNQSSGSGYSTSVPSMGEKSSGVVNESPQRRKAISERNKRTMERAAKALQEKNMRDILAQKEQAERNRYAGVLDAEVKRWSSGKEGNLRSLLSTLQYILGPDSGWQPTPLTDLVTTTAVRKAYKRAALCVHPDKLQQRRATIQQKYICEKVFDLLKDAWHKFNPDDR